MTLYNQIQWNRYTMNRRQWSTINHRECSKAMECINYESHTMINYEPHSIIKVNEMDLL